MLLVIFDIDGTLVQSMRADSQCYTRALWEALNLGNGNHWAHCRHTTDPGILNELFYREYDRPPTDAEIDRFREQFLGLLEAHCASEAFVPVRGATDMLEALAGDPNVALAYGTGAWRRSAELKMSSAGMSLPALPGASGDDAVSREAIVEVAIARAREWYQVKTFERLVYVGDGVWDVDACRNLGLPFVGVGDTAGPECLEREGADYFIADFADQASFRELLRAARPPGARGKRQKSTA